MTRICIIVASHISISIRVKYLCECLNSLINQTIVIPIFLSISFENALVYQIFQKTMTLNNLLENTNIVVFYQDKQTSQFRHIFQVFEIIKNDYDYIMFCDDDDTYENIRVQAFVEALIDAINGMKNHIGKQLVGIYERKNNESHTNAYTEFWNYCIDVKYIQQFITIINNGGFNKHIDNNYFDMMFGSYLRFLDNTHVFGSLNYKLYNYNKYDNSLLGITQANNLLHKKIKYRNLNNPYESLKRCNDYIINNINRMKKNMFLQISRGLNYNEQCVINECFPMEEDRFICLLDPMLILELKQYYTDVKQMAISIGINYD